MTASRDIPEHIRRAVRKQCLFGCVFCGAPLFDYDHVVPFEKVMRHEVDNIVLLCRNHHSDKTHGRLSQRRVFQAKRNPFNLLRTATSSYKIEPNDQIQVRIGSNSMGVRFIDRDGDFYALAADGYELFTVHCEEGWLCVSMKCTDAQGVEILNVDRGAFSVGTHVWDYRYEGNRLRIWEKMREILLDIEMSNEGVVLRKGRFLTSYGTGFLISDLIMTEIVDFSVRTRHGGGLAVAPNVSSTSAYGGWGVQSKRGIVGPLKSCRFSFTGGDPPQCNLPRKQSPSDPV